MNRHEMRLELLRLARGDTSLPPEAEAVIKAARELEKFVFRPEERDKKDSEQC